MNIEELEILFVTNFFLSIFFIFNHSHVYIILKKIKYAVVFVFNTIAKHLYRYIFLTSYNGLITQKRIHTTAVLVESLSLFYPLKIKKKKRLSINESSQTSTLCSSCSLLLSIPFRFRFHLVQVMPGTCFLPG